MVTSVTKVTEEHLVLILWLGAGHTLLAVCALPVVAGHVTQELQAESDTGGVRGLVTLGAVEKQFRHTYLILVYVSVAMLASGQRANLVNSACLRYGLNHCLCYFLLLVPGGVLVSARLRIGLPAA